MKLKTLAMPLAIVAASLLAITAQAANVTPDVIFGSGNANGSFTVGTGEGVELGLRAKVRFPTPENTFNYDGTDTYSFEPGESAPASGRPLWNFEWSINTDFAGSTGTKLDDLTYLLMLDTDPTAGVSYTTSFDLINGLSYFDHAIGDNSTGNGGGTVAGSPADYAGLIADNNVAQNSWAYNWFASIDPNIAGDYSIALQAFFPGTGDPLAESHINVHISAVPLPAALPLYGAGLAVMGFVGWRRKRKLAATA